MTTSRRALLLLILAAGCRKDTDEEAKVEAVVNVGIETVTAQPFTETIGAIGIVQGRPGHVATLTAPMAARVANVLAGVGQHVGAGTPLVELEQTSFVGAMRSADAGLAAAERNYERTKRLVDAGIAPRKDLDQATTDLERARADAGTARRQQELSLLRAPIAGVVTRVNAVMGATADPSQVLVEIADPSSLDIFFNVSPTEAGRIQRGAKVALSAGQSASGESLGVGSVVDVGGAVDADTRGVAVRVQAPTTRRPLRIGETVYGEIVAVIHPKAIVVPIDALVPDGEAFKVFVVNAAGVAHARTVEIGGRSEKFAEITSGLAAGERIVTYGAYGIEDSAKVVPLATPKP